MGQGQSADAPPAKTFSSNTQREETNDDNDEPVYPTPTGHEYDEIDKLQAELPSMIDDESRQQVDE